jgi:predicted small lipoprotein YifL
LLPVTPEFNRRRVLAGLALLSPLLLAACGRRGPLEPPPSTAVPVGAPGSRTDLPQPAPKEGETPPPPKPPRPFVLDALID